MTVYDAATGATWEVNPGSVQVTASIVKVDVMADALSADQSDRGASRRSRRRSCPR